MLAEEHLAEQQELAEIAALLFVTKGETAERSGNGTNGHAAVHGVSAWRATMAGRPFGWRVPR